MPFLAIFIQIPSLAAWLASIQDSNSACELNARVSTGRPIVHSRLMTQRSITALLAVLALLVAVPAAFAQSATPTPGGPPADASKAVKAIYTDYRSDGKIDVCDHERTDLQDALDTIEPEFDTDNPDFRAALEAGIQRHDDGRCDSDATPTATATATATETATAAPTADDGALPPPDDSGSGDSGALPPRRRLVHPGARRWHVAARGRRDPRGHAGRPDPGPDGHGPARGHARRERHAGGRRERRRTGACWSPES